MADIAVFETHLKHLIQAIPRDGSTVDLRELFYRLTIDSATEFLFGESTNCVAPGASAQATKFADAFDPSQEAAASASRDLPILAKLFPRSSITKDIKYAHEFVDHYVKLGLEWQKKQDVEKSVSKGGERYIFLYELAKSIQDPCPNPIGASEYSTCRPVSIIRGDLTLIPGVGRGWIAT